MVTPLIQRLDRITLLLERLLDATPTVPPLALTGTDHDTRSRVGDTAASRAADRLAPADYFLNTRQLCDRLQFWLNQPDLDEIQAFLKGAPAEFERVTTELEGATAEVLQSAKDLRLRPILNAIVIAALRATQAGRDEIAETASSSFFKIYERARTLRFPESTGVELDAIWVWLEIMRRVYVLGAYMIASSKLIRVSTLANQSPTFDPNWRGFLWARHALTETGRANRLTSKGLVGEALNELSRETNLLGLLSLDTEVLTDALCQYDLLQCIFALHKRPQPSSIYPSCAWYYRSRVEKLLHAILADPHVRNSAIPAMDDSRLREILQIIDAVSTSGSFATVAGWADDHWQDALIVSFLRPDHQTARAQEAREPEER